MRKRVKPCVLWQKSEKIRGRAKDLSRFCEKWLDFDAVLHSMLKPGKE